MTDRAYGLRVVSSGSFCLIPDGDREQGTVMDQALTIWVRREPGYVMVIVAGEIDYATVPQLRARLSALTAVGRPLVVDLDEVSYVDAAGLGALVSAAKRAAAHGTSLHVVCAVRQTRRLFRITGLDRVIPLAGTLAEALQALAAGSPLAAAPGGAAAV